MGPDLVVHLAVGMPRRRNAHQESFQAASHDMSHSAGFMTPAIAWTNNSHLDCSASNCFLPAVVSR